MDIYSNPQSSKVNIEVNNFFGLYHIKTLTLLIEQKMWYSPYTVGKYIRGATVTMIVKEKEGYIPYN